MWHRQDAEWLYRKADSRLGLATIDPFYDRQFGALSSLAQQLAEWCCEGWNSQASGGQKCVLEIGAVQ